MRTVVAVALSCRPSPAMNAPARSSSLPNASQRLISACICSGVTSSQPPSSLIKVSMYFIEFLLGVARRLSAAFTLTTNGGA